MRNFSKFLFWVSLGGLFSLTLVGCGSSRGGPVRSSFVEFTPEQQVDIKSKATRPYQLQAGDYLRVAFIHQKELTQDAVLVLPDGSVNLIGVDRVDLAGLTPTEADSVITLAYSKEYRDPQLSVIVLESRGRMVYVLGEVRSPGLFTLPRGGLGPVGAVALAGGFSEDAAKEGTVLVRVTPSGYLVQELDLANLHDPGNFPLAMVELLPFDVIYVPRSRIGDFAYFSASFLQGILSITRIASDITYMTQEGVGRY